MQQNTQQNICSVPVQWLDQQFSSNFKGLFRQISGDFTQYIYLA